MTKCDGALVFSLSSIVSAGSERRLLILQVRLWNRARGHRDTFSLGRRSSYRNWSLLSITSRAMCKRNLRDEVRVNEGAFSLASLIGRSENDLRARPPACILSNRPWGLSRQVAINDHCILKVPHKLTSSLAEINNLCFVVVILSPRQIDDPRFFSYHSLWRPLWGGPLGESCRLSKGSCFLVIMSFVVVHVSWIH